MSDIKALVERLDAMASHRLTSPELCETLREAAHALSSLSEDAEKWRNQQRMLRSNGHDVDEYYKDSALSAGDERKKKAVPCVWRTGCKMENNQCQEVGRCLAGTTPVEGAAGGDK